MLHIAIKTQTVLSPKPPRVLYSSLNYRMRKKISVCVCMHNYVHVCTAMDCKMLFQGWWTALPFSFSDPAGIQVHSVIAMTKSQNSTVS